MTLLEARGQRGQRRLWLVRHGESTWNVLGLAQGRKDVPTLTRRGAEQARRCARLLAGEPVGAIVSSDLPASGPDSATDRSLAATCRSVTTRRLRERSLAPPKGRRLPSCAPTSSVIAGGRVVDADAAPAGGRDSASVLCPD